MSESLVDLRRQARRCRRCPLYRGATQTVFGEGPADAQIVLVGEQPGDQEDQVGSPFVGPAGRVLDRALEMAGIDRKAIYVTNAVKHFKFEPRGKRRLHKRPNASEIEACQFWLGQELAAIKPKLVIALGATAARSLLGYQVIINSLRRKSVNFGSWPGSVTVHPSSLLRIPDSEQAQKEFRRFVDDLKNAVVKMRKLQSAA